MMFRVVFFAVAGQRQSPARESVNALPAKFRAAIYSDINRVAENGFSVPVSIRTITGHTPMREIRTGGYRTFFVVDRGEMWVLHCCKKQDQRRAIEIAAERMTLVLER